MAKLHRGIKKLAKEMMDDGEPIAQVDLTNISSLEIFQIRSFLMGSLNHFRQLSLPPSSLARQSDERSGGYVLGGGGGGGGADSATSRFGSRLSRAIAPPTAATESGAGDGGEGGSSAMPASTRKLRRIH
jgi:hypothetical protein